MAIQKRGVTIVEDLITTVYQIFGLTFHLYGFLIALGILASAQASSWLAKRRKLPKEVIWDGLWWVIIPAIVGARLYHVMDRWGDVYSLNPIKTIFIWEGGLGVLGGLVGGVLGLWLYCRKARFTIHDLRFMTLLDLVFFGLPLGQAIGRFGNFANQELYGLPSSLPWALFIDPKHRLAGFEQFSTFHPLFAYEAIWNFLGFLIMFFSERSDLIRSDLLKPIRRSFTGFYLIWYGFGRFFLEFLRVPELVWRVGGIDMAQVLSAGMIGIGIWLIRYTRSFGSSGTRHSG